MISKESKKNFFQGSESVGGSRKVVRTREWRRRIA